MEEVLRDISEGVEDVIVKLHSDINQFHFPFEVSYRWPISSLPTLKALSAYILPNNGV